jgi:hypothetical protein
MAYTRTSATTHLSNEFAALASETGQAVTDSTAGFGPAIDRALRTLGVTEADLAAATVADANVPAFLALCEYHALARIWRSLATRADVSARNVMGPRAQVFQHVKDLVTEAANTCASYGYPVGTPIAGGAGSGGSWQAGSLTLDIIEPWDVTTP